MLPRSNFVYGLYIARRFHELTSANEKMEARNRPLDEWFLRISSGQIVLPRFQRFEAWSHKMVSELLDTVLRGLPAGALLVLEVGDTEAFVSREMVGAPETDNKATEQLLDGQQRLTALWRSLTDNYSDRTFFVKVEPNDMEDIEDTEDPEAIIPWAESQARWGKNGKRYPLWVDDPVKVWERKLIPLRLLSPTSKSTPELNSWAQAAAKGNKDDQIKLITLGGDLRDKIARFNIPFLSLPIGTPNGTALDVFVKMNTSAQPLTPYDIVVAQVEAATGLSLHEFVEELKEEVPDLEHFTDLPPVILNAGALLQDRPANRSTMLGLGFAEGLIDNWNRIVDGAQRAARFLSEEKILDAKRIPSDAATPLLVALWAHAPDGLDGEGEARLVLRKFLWRAFLTDRYERATNSRTFADYKLLVPMLKGRDDGVPPIFKEDVHPLPRLEDLLLAGWPKKKDRLSRSALLISLREGGLDFADGSPAHRDNLNSREYHHIFPVRLLEKMHVSDDKIFRAMNCALVTWKTNRNIAAKTPVEYLQDRINASSLSEKEIRRRLLSHCIDYDILAKGDYDEFISARAEALMPYVQQLGEVQ